MRRKVFESVRGNFEKVGNQQTGLFDHVSLTRICPVCQKKYLTVEVVCLG